MKKNLLLILFVVFCNFFSFAQNQQDLSIVVLEKVSSCNDLKKHSYVKVSLNNFNAEQKNAFFSSAEIYNQYLLIEKTNSTDPDTYTIKLIHSDGWKYIGRFFITSGIQIVHSNNVSIPINQFIKISK